MAASPASVTPPEAAQAAEDRWQVVPYSADRQAEYLQFALTAWGNGSYQSRPGYLRWLYEAAPDTRPKQQPLLLGLRNGAIVGAIHQMTLPWRWRDAFVQCNNIHNLFVREDARSGLGMPLIQMGLRAGDSAFVAGVSAPLNQIYERMRCTRLQPAWYRTVLAPLKLAAFAFARSRDGVFAPELNRRLNELILTTQPAREEVAEMTNRLQIRSEQRGGIAWNEALFRWRFLHPDGPRHVFALLRDGSFIVFSMGIRQRARVARLIEAHAGTGGALIAESKRIWRELAAAGFEVLLGFSGDKELVQILDQMPWKRLANPPFSYLFHRKHPGLGECAISAAAGDFGFEAIP